MSQSIASEPPGKLSINTPVSFASSSVKFHSPSLGNNSGNLNLNLDGNNLSTTSLSNPNLIPKKNKIAAGQTPYAVGVLSDLSLCNSIAGGPVEVSTGVSVANVAISTIGKD